MDRDFLKKNAVLVNIFLEEARGLLKAISLGLQDWASDLNNPAYLLDIKREFHTLKGGACMVHQAELSALVESLESLAEALLASPDLSDGRGHAEICKGCDRLRDLIESLSMEQARAQKQPLVLVVDDSITIRMVTQQFLEQHHYRVLSAVDGIEALEKLEQEKPDIILLDIEMPRMNGLDCAEKIRKNKSFSKIPIIMITFCEGQSEKDRAQKLGIEKFIPKPFEESTLLEAIKAFI